MPTAPYAKLRASLGGGAPASGVLVGAPGQTCQLSQDLAGGGTTFKYELRDYPEGWACPADWATDSGGVYYYVGATPPPFTLPALPLWGKILPVLTVNSGDPGTSGLPATQFVDRSTVLSTPDPSGNGFEDIAYGESNQWDVRRKWMGSLKRNIRRMAAGGVVGALGPYESATQRRAAVLTSADIRKEALQTDTSPPTLWKVLTVSGGVGTWTRIDTGAESSALAAILGAEPAWWIDGITSTIVDAGGGVASSASDASGHGFNATFGSGARPSIIANGKNGKRTLRFTSAQFGGNAGFAAPAPGTTPVYTFMVVKSATAAASSVFLSTGANAIYIGGGPAVADYNGGTGPFSSVITPGTWYIVEVLRTNQNTDYAQLNGSGGTVGTSAGNTANTGFTLNAFSGGTQGGDNEYATIFEWLGTPPDSTKRTALRAWANGLWNVYP